MTAVEQVIGWYHKHRHKLAATFSETEIRSFNEADAVQGKVVIEVETTNVCGVVTFWNKGDVEVECLRLSNGSPVTPEPTILDDRLRAESEDIAALLDSYFQQIAANGRQ